VLYNSSEELIPPIDADKKRFAAEYGRNFQPGIIDGVPCLVSLASGK